MDIRQLHYFLTLCEEMNYTRAAQRLFLSRQALRQSISALEAEMCGPLFISAHHKLALTDRGMSLQRHAAPVVEQFQQMQAALRAEIQSAQPVHIGISVALVPDYLPGLETQLDKFRQQYPHVEMRFRLLDNDAVADGVEQGELDAGLVIDLGCAAPVLARTTLRADPACLLVPRGHPFWEKERIPLAELRGQRVLLPSLRQDYPRLYSLSPAQSAAFGDGPAVYYTNPGWAGSVGFISPVHGKEPFCTRCNRVRLSASGFLRPCLASEEGVELGEMLRGGASDVQLLEAIRAAVRSKPLQHPFHPWDCLDIPVTRDMYRIGG